MGSLVFLVSRVEKLFGDSAGEKEAAGASDQLCSTLVQLCCTKAIL